VLQPEFRGLGVVGWIFFMAALVVPFAVAIYLYRQLRQEQVPGTAG